MRHAMTTPRWMSSLRHAALTLGLALLALVVATGCQREIKVSDKDLTQIQYKDLQALIETSKEGQLVLLDPRRANHFDNGHLPGAINIFLPDIQPGDARLAKAQHIVVYGGGWADPISGAAGKRLMALGYKGVADFRGGLDAWRAEGRLVAVTRSSQDQDGRSPANP